jgi:hypothetical protein
LVRNPDVRELSGFCVELFRLTLSLPLFLCVRAHADKEEMKEMQKQMAENDPQKMLSNLFGNKQKDDDDDD